MSKWTKIEIDTLEPKKPESSFERKRKIFKNTMKIERMKIEKPKKNFNKDNLENDE